MKKSSLSIIILNYNRKEDALELLQSLNKQVYKQKKIFVVDNASSDGSINVIKQAYPNVRLIKLRKNIGRSAQNKGAAVARGDVLVFLDADVYFTDKKFLEKLAAKFEKKNIDAVSFFMKDPTGKTYGWEPTYIKSVKKENGHESTFGGGMWAIRRRIFEKVGGFNPNFFVYVDEWEYLIRLWRNGYTVRYFEDLIGYHKESPYAYRSVMKGYHVIVNYAQIYALYLPVSVWFRFFRHHAAQSVVTFNVKEASKIGVIKGLFLASFFFLKALSKRNAINGKALEKFLQFYFPEKGKVVVGKWGW